MSRSQRRDPFPPGPRLDAFPRARGNLLNSRFGYVSVSRAGHETTLFTKDAAKLGQQLKTETSKTAALEISQPPSKGEGNSAKMIAFFMRSPTPPSARLVAANATQIALWVHGREPELEKQLAAGPSATATPVTPVISSMGDSI